MASDAWRSTDVASRRARVCVECQYTVIYCVTVPYAPLSVSTPLQATIVYASYALPLLSG